jgi:hypothetical protein
MDNPQVVDSGPDFERLMADRHEIAQITIATDGGPWAIHNFPCPICLKRPAILNLNTGVFEPCGVDRAEGWTIIRWKHLRWERFTRWLRTQ